MGDHLVARAYAKLVDDDRDENMRRALAGVVTKNAYLKAIPDVLQQWW